MLKQRVITALVLAAILLPALFGSLAIWGIATALLAAMAAFEWARLLGLRGRGAVATGVVFAVGALAYLAARLSGAAGAVSLGALLSGMSLGFWILVAPRRLRAHSMRAGGVAYALVLTWGCWIAMFELTAIGPWTVLSTMAIVFVADIAAYFVGRAFGRRKLAPRISPGKSQEGAAGGVIAVVVLGLLLAAWGGLPSPSVPGALVQRIGWIGAGVGLAWLAGLSIIGDLAESLLKREAGVKDSGNTLPGHGGVLDRIDAQLPVLPAAWLLLLWLLH